MTNPVVSILIRARDLSRQAIDSARSGLSSLSGSNDSLSTATARATAAQNAQNASTDTLSNRTRSATRSIVALGASYLGLNKLKEGFLAILDTGGRFEKLGIQLNGLMGSIEGGERATQWIKDFAKNTPFQVEGVTKAFVKMKAYGLDPMNGSMQAIADQTAKLGGGQAELEGIVLGLGQAWTKQKLQAEEANQLIERGVPVWSLLAEATGKTAAELMKMSEAGKVGRTEIQLLIEAMGKSSEGTAKSMMTTWVGMISNMQDTWSLFLNEIATSGALDYAKDQLSSLLATAKEMAEDGSLKEWAKDISDSITVTAEVVMGFADAVRISFNVMQIAATVLIKTFVDVAEGVNSALAAITFGDTSAAFQKTADDLKLYSRALKDGVKEDATDIKSAWDSLTGSSSDMAAGVKSDADSIAESQKAVGEAALLTAKNFDQAGVVIDNANKKAGQSSDQLLAATGKLKIDLSQLRGVATVAGTDAAAAFKVFATEADLTKQQLEQVALKALAFARTKGDIDLLKQSFADVGFEAEKHPQLIDEIITKIQSMGGGLSSIPESWNNIANATENATAKVIDHAQSISQAAKQQEKFNSVLEYENKILNQRAAREAAEDKAAQEKADKQSARVEFRAFSNVATDQLSQLTAENKDEFKRLSQAANVSNQLAAWQPSTQMTNEEIIKHLYDRQTKEEKQRSAPSKTINVNFKANGQQSTASFASKTEADNFLDILKTAGSVS